MQLAFVAAGAFAALWTPSPQWVEHAFANGYYPGWQRFWLAITRPLPFALGDFVYLGGVLAILWRIVARIRAARAHRSWLPVARMLLDLGAIAGALSLWFFAGWGWGYDRAPVEDRTAFSQTRITPQAMESLRARAVVELNHLAPLAHARQADAYDRTLLYTSWAPVVTSLGNTWQPVVEPTKPTLAGPYMDLVGITGFINPFTLESSLAPDVLWFETPMSQAHEWSHDAGYNREDEANYIGIITCLRSHDPAIAYSGWFELFLYLPRQASYDRKTFVPLVWQDFAAFTARNQRHVNLTLSRFAWKAYDTYLKSNHITSGVENYNEVTRLLLGIPLDGDGLPVASSPT